MLLNKLSQVFYPAALGKKSYVYGTEYIADREQFVPYTKIFQVFRYETLSFPQTKK